MASFGRNPGGSSQSADEVIQILLTATDRMSPEFLQALDTARAFADFVPKVKSALEAIGEGGQAAATGLKSMSAAEQEAERSIASQVKAAESAQNSIKLYTQAAQELANLQNKGLGTKNAGTDELAAGINLADRALEQFQAQLDKAPQGALALADGVRLANQALKEQEAQLKKTATTAEQYARQYQQAQKGLATAERVNQNIYGQRTDALNSPTPVDPAHLAELKAAQNLANDEIQRYKDIIASLPAGTQAYSAAIKQEQDALRAEEAAMKKTATAVKEQADAHGKARETAEELSRGLASSLFGFSLLAGGIVGFGHLIGNAINDAVQSANRLHSEIDDITQLSPRINTQDLYNQFTDIEQRLGIVSEKLTATFKYAAPAAGGDSSQAIAVTEQLARGAQANAANPAAWAEAATGTLKAYNLQVQDLTRVQDLLTTAMQNSYGQGDSIIKMWSSLAKAASNAHVSMEDNAAAITVLAQHGGDLEENLRALKGAYDALSTDQTQKQLQAYGYAVRDAAGNSLPLLDIIQQLRDRLKGANTGEQDTEIGRFFQDRDVRNVVKTLVSAQDDYTAAQAKYADQAGATAKASVEWMRTDTARLERMNALQQSWNEKLGDFFNLQKQVSNATFNLSVPNQMQMLPDWESFNDKQKAAVNDFVNSHRITTAQDFFNPLSNNFGSTFDNDKIMKDLPDLKQRIQDLSDEVAKCVPQIQDLSKAEDQASQSAQDCIPKIIDLSGKGEALEAASRKAAEGLIFLHNWQGQVVESSSSLTPKLEGVSQKVQDIYQAAANLSQSNAFGGFASAAERDLATVSQKMQETAQSLQFSQSHPISGDPSSTLGRFQSTMEAGLKNQLTQYMKEAQDLAQEIEKNSPEYIAKKTQATHEWQDFQRDAQYASIFAAEEKKLSDVTDGYNKQIKSLTDQQQTLQRQLRDNSTPELSSAYNTLLTTTKALTDATQSFDDKLQSLDNQLYDTAQKAKAAEDPLKATLDDAEKAYSDFTTQAEAQTHGLDVNIHNLTESLKTFDDGAKRSLDPYITALNQANGWLLIVQANTKLMDELFTNMEKEVKNSISSLDSQEKALVAPLQEAVDGYKKQLESLQHAEEMAVRPIDDALKIWKGLLDQINNDEATALKPVNAEIKKFQDQIDGIDADAAKAFRPVDDEIQKLSKHLRDLDRAHELTMRPIEDAIYDQSAALKSAQAEVSRLSEYYANKLLPLQRELNELRRADQADEDQKRLANEKASVENLAARLANAKAGSAEYLQLLNQQADAQNKLSRDTREVDLSNKIQDIENERDSALEGAQKRVAAEQATLDALEAQRAQLERIYELETRPDRDRLTDLKNQREDLQADYDNRKRLVEDDLKLQQAAAKAITDKYEAEKTTVNEVISDYNRRRGVITDAYDSQIRDTNDALYNAQQALNTEQGYWDKERGLLTDKLAALQGVHQQYDDNASIAEQSAQRAVNAAQGELTGMQASFDAIHNGWQGLINDAQAERDKVDWNNTEQARILKLKVDDAKTNLEGVQKYWDGITNSINTERDAVTHNRDLTLPALQKLKSDAEENYKGVRDAVQDAINKLGDQVNTVRDVATETEGAAKRQIDAQRAVQSSIKDTIAAWNAVQAAVKGGVDVDPDKLHMTDPYAPPTDPNAGKPYTPSNSKPVTAPPDPSKKHNVDDDSVHSNAAAGPGAGVAAHHTYGIQGYGDRYGIAANAGIPSDPGAWMGTGSWDDDNNGSSSTSPIKRRRDVEAPVPGGSAIGQGPLIDLSMVFPINARGEVSIEALQDPDLWERVGDSVFVGMNRAVNRSTGMDINLQGRIIS